MDALPTTVTPLLVHLVQATWFGGLIVLLLLSLPFVSARLRHVLGWIGLMKFVLPLGLLGVALPWSASRLLSGGWLPSQLVTDRTPSEISASAGDDRIWPVVLSVWLLGVLLLTAVAVARSLRLARQLRAERRPFPVETQQTLHALAATVGLRSDRLTGWVTGAQTTPGVSGIFRSRIHIPRELLHSLAPDELEAVLLHELAHIRRRDNLWRILQTVIVCLCWFHPLVWWLHRRLMLESERACDEAVVRRTRNGEVYAQGLFKAARFALGLDVPGFSGMARSGLKTRLAAVLKPIKEKDHPMLRLSLILLVGIGFVGTSGAIAADPAAQKSEVLDVGKLDRMPKPIDMPRPSYPVVMRDQGVDGKVVVEFVVDKNGDVRLCHATSATSPEFEAAAIAAVSQWKFHPGLKGGRAVNTRMAVPIVFDLPKVKDK